MSEVMGRNVPKGCVSHLTQESVHEMDMFEKLLFGEMVQGYHSAGMVATWYKLVTLENGFQESRAKRWQALLGP